MRSNEEKKREIDGWLPWVKEGVEVEDYTHPHGSRELESKAAQSYF